MTRSRSNGAISNLQRYEQRQILDADDDALRHHSEVTWLCTLGMSVVAREPVPGGRPLREVVPGPDAARRLHLHPRVRPGGATGIP